MKLNTKILVISLGGLAAMLIISLLATAVYFNRIKKAQIEKSAMDAKKQFEVAMEAKNDVWLTSALQVAANENVKKALRDNDRKLADSILKRLGKTFKENTGFKNVQVHLIDKNLHSFYKSWAPDKHGEALGYSKGYVQVKNTLRPDVAMEVSGKGLRLKGLFPILDGPEFLGIANFEGGLNSIKRTLKTHDIDFLYFMDAKDLNVAEEMKGKPRLGEFILNQKDMDEGYWTYLEKPGILTKILDAPFFLDKEYLNVQGQFKGFDEYMSGLYMLGVKNEIALANVHALEKLIFTMYGLLFGIFLLFIVVLVFFMNRSVVTPIKNIAEGMKDIAQGEGDLTKRLKVVSRDEIGLLGYEFNTFIEKLDNLIWHVNDRNQNLGLVSNELSGVAALMSATAGRVSTEANKVAGAAEEMNSNMNTVAAAVEQITVNANHVAAATDEMTSAITEISGNTDKTREITHQAVEDAESASAKIGELQTSAQAIGNVLNVIQEISEQTNLLALNATIEAARAGEAGKGFAVVAEEIKQLANQTSRATVGIREKVENIQSVSSQAVEEIGRVATTINDVDDQVTTVAASIEEQARTTEDISSNIQQVSAGISDIQKTMLSASEVSDQIAREIHAVKTASEEMREYSNNVENDAEDQNRMAVDVIKMMSQFQMSDNKFHAAPVKRTHSLWKKKLSNMLSGKQEDIRMDQLIDHRHCDFGKWYFGPGMEKYGKSPDYQKLGEIHEKVHETGGQVAKLFKEGNINEAHDIFKTYGTVSRQLFDLLDGLEKQT
ncbi:methyl-accepting chemotaxis protein [uncultured Desulfobacter sp.]|uniref:methyl-accepting chemotaxis protein n=1 Tax=uncultured Desulfobacter sp. TaxID=240139 RepID=UPI002AAB24EA|nr:methyl-accepting chemotaxis protein [uncultured Desulfobacter sp.]